MTLIWFIILLGPLVFFHELGHFLTAKAFNVKVLSFSLGFGPVLWKKQIGETEYRLSAIPLGGYVGMIGEDPNEELAEEDKNRTLASLALWKKLLVITAGPLVNLLIPVLIFFGYYLSVSTVSPPLMGTVLPGTPAEKAGIHSGDLVLSINGKELNSFNQFRRIIKSSPGETLDLKIKTSGGEIKHVTMKPAERVGLNILGLKQKVGRAGVFLNTTLAVAGIRKTSSNAYAKGVRTGDRIIALEHDGKRYAVKFWTEFVSLRKKIKDKQIKLILISPSESVFKGLGVSVGQIKSLELNAEDLSDIEPGELYVSDVTEGSAADKWGIVKGSRIAGIRVMKKDEKVSSCVPSSKLLKTYASFEEKLMLYPDKRFCITWITPSPDGKCFHTAVLLQDKLKSVDELGHKLTSYELGIASWRAMDVPEDVPVKNRFWFAASESVIVTWDLTVGMIKGIYYMITGKIERENLGGVVAIAQMAKIAADRGFFFFLQMMAILSLNFFLLNLLPIPLLDGGHALLFIIEAIIRKPLTMAVRTAITYAGLGIVVFIMLYGFRNDLVRVFRSETDTPSKVDVNVIEETTKGLLSPQPQKGVVLPCLKQ